MFWRNVEMVEKGGKVEKMRNIVEYERRQLEDRI